MDETIISLFNPVPPGFLSAPKDVILNPARPTDFFAIITSGKITVEAGVTRMDGIYISNGNFVVDGPNNTPLTINGEVIAGGIADGSPARASIGGVPSIQFVFNPALISNMPASLKNNSSFDWKLIQR